MTAARVIMCFINVLYIINQTIDSRNHVISRDYVMLYYNITLNNTKQIGVLRLCLRFSICSRLRDSAMGDVPGGC